ncbi:MAG: hydrogenase formation protein HypD [Deltaproteobacteria bacterium]|nr:MAG: hydrogenase formation protein HypD [Deltaproteobacteria bacterium]
MKQAGKFREPEITRSLLNRLTSQVKRPLRIMEVCGTHTMSIFRHGIRSLLPPEVELLSGPGCPVCVTSASHIDAFLEAARLPGVTVATFGDLIRVPGATGSLASARAEGCRVEIVYSPMDALELARREPEQTVLFPGIGFETTAPTVAATILEARRLKLDNFCIIAAAKIMPPPLDQLMQAPDLNIDGLLCPGHVSAIIGTDAYAFLPKRYGLACAVAGFEPADIISGLVSLTDQINTGKPRVDNCYTRAVSSTGNLRAQQLMELVFQAKDSEWRGLGILPGSGLELRSEFAEFDACKRFGIRLRPSPEPKGCRCGDVLKGSILPTDCPLYSNRCTPLHPIGPCMVSSEGTCAAYYRYSDNTK